MDAVIRECKKENMEYKIEGIKAVGPILETHNLDRFQEIYDILFPHLKQVKLHHKLENQPQLKHLKIAFVQVSVCALFKIVVLLQNDSNKKDEDEEISKDTRLEFQASAYQCLGEAWPTNREAQSEHLTFSECLFFSPKLKYAAV